MKTKLSAQLAICLFSLWMICSASWAELTEFEQRALTAMGAWVELVDDGQYEESWNQTGIYFQNMVTQVQWRQSLEFAREPLGEMISRSIISADLKTSLPGAPNGQYLVVQYQTQFKHKKQAVETEAVETVTSHIDKQGVWRVVGYFVR